jgi:hypothetical protein
MWEWSWQFEFHDSGWNQYSAVCKECKNGFDPQEGQELHDFLVVLYDHWSECGG